MVKSHGSDHHLFDHNQGIGLTMKMLHEVTIGTGMVQSILSTATKALN
jgi:predicted RNA binding protein YcfA (HicA-like mRNA interferase family)